MAFVPLVNSNAQLLMIDSAGTSRNMTAFWVSGHPEITQEAVEVTSIADTAKRNLIGLTDTNLSFSFNFDNTTGSAGMYHTFTKLKNAGSAGTAQNIIYYPDGTASGKPIITVAAKLTAFNFGGGVGEKVTMDVTFVADGVPTLGTV